MSMKQAICKVYGISTRFYNKLNKAYDLSGIIKCLADSSVSEFDEAFIIKNGFAFSTAILKEFNII